MALGEYSDELLRTILTSSRTIAVVGASTNRQRPVYGVMKYLMAQRYEVIPVNPRYAGDQILGQPALGSLSDIPGPIDIVDIFRRHSALAAVVDAAIALDLRPRVIWMQLGLRDEAAAAKADAAGMTVIMDRCILIEHKRLGLDSGSS
jgi:predicted CoA-binding protein